MHFICHDEGYSLFSTFFIFCSVETGLESVVSVVPDDFHDAIFLAGDLRGTTTLLRVIILFGLHRRRVITILYELHRSISLNV